MRTFFPNSISGMRWVLLLSLLLSACLPMIAPLPLEENSAPAPAAAGEALPVSAELSGAFVQTPRPLYQPGELADYVAQTGDTLPALAVRFNTTVEEIRLANPFIPADATTMPPGMPMRIPIYYLPLWGSQYKIIPDSLFVNGPSQVEFDTREFVNAQPGWLKNYSGFASGQTRSGAQLVDLAAQNFSISPRLLLALLEYHSGALSQPLPPENAGDYALQLEDKQHRGVFLQLVWAANNLNNGYYTWRNGTLTSLYRQDGTIERPDPWQNTASVAIQYFYSKFFSTEDYLKAISPDGLAATYAALFGDPWQSDQPHIPGSLNQPEFYLPFEPGTIWSLTGGPHTGWGEGEPLAAIDFAPPTVKGGCVDSDEWVTAVAPGLVVRSEPGIVVLDLDQDGDERTGWVVFHLHVGSVGRAPVGAVLQVGDRIGPPSCEGGTSTGTHVHMGRKYNGEWILAAGVLAFNLEGWIAQNGSRPYLGSLKRYSQVVIACECSNSQSFIRSDRPRP